MLQIRDYDAKADKIFVHRLKGSNSGHHHLVRDEARALRAWLKVRGSVPGPIFLSKQKRAIDRTTLHLLMKKYGAAAGIPAKLRHFHVLKHCCATHLLSKGFGVRRGAGPGLDRTRQYTIDHGIRQGDECQEG